MEIVNNKIVSATEEELFDYWLKRFEDIYTFDEFLFAMKHKGVNIVNNITKVDM